MRLVIMLLKRQNITVTELKNKIPEVSALIYINRYNTYIQNLIHVNQYNTYKQQSVAKTMGKTAIWTILCFYPLPTLNNVEKQWAKVASSYVMGSQHCVGGEGEFYILFFQIPIIFCHRQWNLQKEKKNKVLYMLFQKT